MDATVSSLKKIDTKQGTGAEAVTGRSVAVHYTGWLYDPSKPDGKGAKKAPAPSIETAAMQAALSAPLAVIDPDTRETLGDRAQHVGETFGNTFKSAADVVPGR